MSSQGLALGLRFGHLFQSPHLKETALQQVKQNIKPTTLWAMVIVVLIAAVALWQTAQLSRLYFLNDIKERSSHTLNLVVENLRGQLAKFRSQPKLLSANPDFVTILQGRATKQQISNLNLELERVKLVTGALDTYLMNKNGLTVAASNWAEKRTFIGKNFSYRPYFIHAMEGRLGRYFALGTTSKERGYYFAYPVRHQGVNLGAIVVKMSVGHLERSWRANDHEIFVADDDGIVFLSSNPAWRFKALFPLSSKQSEKLKKNRKYGIDEFQLLSHNTEDKQPGKKVAGTITDLQFVNHISFGKGNEKKDYLLQTIAMEEAGWHVFLLTNTGQLNRSVQISLMVVGFMLASLALLGANFYQRRRRLADRIAMQEMVKIELENRVEERTVALTKANRQLTSEVEERTRTANELRRTQDELLQASKLAALGQLSAGLRHELNQPLTAIQSYADNGKKLLEQGKIESVNKNLISISDLTNRMARITRNLHTFSNETAKDLKPLKILPVLEETLVMLSERLKKEKLKININQRHENLMIEAGDVRLQQVFVNLITNALDAMKSSSDKQLDITAHQVGEEVVISFQDYGPGIDEAIIPNLFDPFFTTKGVGDGMGLGLSITYGIIKQFGGRIDVSNSDGKGANFKLIFKAMSQSLGEKETKPDHVKDINGRSQMSDDEGRQICDEVGQNRSGSSDQTHWEKASHYQDEQQSEGERT